MTEESLMNWNCHHHWIYQDGFGHFPCFFQFQMMRHHHLKSQYLGIVFFAAAVLFGFPELSEQLPLPRAVLYRAGMCKGKLVRILVEYPRQVE